MDEELIDEEDNMFQQLLEAGYSERELNKYLETNLLTKELFERLINEKEEQVVIDKDGNVVRFNRVNHSKRAAEFERESDGNTAKYVNIALKYFGYRCALSGEKFASFGEDKIENSSARSNLSAEHVVPLCQGGDDVYPNIVPSVLQYNLSKNGYNLLDWWNRQEDKNGKSIYSPYRLLKLVNYMMKSLDARKQGLNIKKYEEAILDPNEIDKFLQEIEKEDDQEQDNSRRKIKSDIITATEEKDGKKILTKIPAIKGHIAEAEEQQKEQYDEIRAMDIFLANAIRTLKEDKELSEHEEYNEIIGNLESMYEKVVGVIPFEIVVMNKIIDRLKEMGIEENIYTVANELLRNTDILKIAKEKEEGIDEYIAQFFEDKERILSQELNLTEEQIKIAITNIPDILFDESVVKRINFYQEYRSDRLDRYIKGESDRTDNFIDNLIILKRIGVDTNQLREIDTIESLAEKSGIGLEKLIEAGLNPEDRIGSTKRNIVQAYRGNVANKPPTPEQAKELEELGIQLEKKEQDTVKKFIESIKILQEIGVNTNKIGKKDTVESLAKKSGIGAEKLIEVGLNPKDKIGSTKNNIVQAYRGKGTNKPPTPEQAEELKELGISLEIKEQDTVQKFIENIKILQEIGVDTNQLKQRDTIKSLAKKSEIGVEKLIEAGLNPTDRIGSIKNSIAKAYRGGKGGYKPPTPEQAEELKKLGISLEIKEQDTVQEFIESIKILQEIGVDTNQLKQKDTIKSLAKKSGIGVEKLIEAGLNPTDKIGSTKNNIALAYRGGKGGYKPPTQEQVEELKKLGISLEKKEQDTVQKFIENIKILQEIGVDTNQLSTMDTIKSLAKKSGIGVEKLIEAGLNPTDKIGSTKKTIAMAYRGKGTNKPPTPEQAEELKELGISLEIKEQDAVQKFIENIKILQEIGVDTDQLKQKDTIESLAAKSGIRVEKLIEAGLNPTYTIGSIKNSIAKAYRGGKGGYKPPTPEQAEELKKLGISLEIKEQDTVQEFIESIKILQEIGVDTNQLKQKDTIKSLAKKSGIGVEKLIEAGLNPTDKIGSTKNNIASAYRGNGNSIPPTPEQVEELKELGISLEKKKKGRKAKDKAKEIENKEESSNNTLTTSDTIDIAKEPDVQMEKENARNDVSKKLKIEENQKSIS